MRRLVTPAVLGLVAFFALLSLSTGALTNFSVVALVSLYGVTLSVANAALTVFLLATAFGVLAGGFIADATRRHGDVAAAGFAGAAALVALVGAIYPGPVLLAVCLGVAGFLSGMIAPSRDMLVRAAAPPGAVGPGVRHRHHRVQYRRHDRANAGRLDHGSPSAALGVLFVGGVHADDGGDGAGQRAADTAQRRAGGGLRFCAARL